MDDIRSADASFMSARDDHQRGNFDAAAAGYLKVLSIHPGHADAKHLLGVLYAQRGFVSDAEKLIREAIALKDIWAYHDNLGKCLQEQGRVEEALAAYERAVMLNPSYRGGHNAIGALAAQLGDAARAEAAFRAVVQMMPDSASAHSNLGNALADLGRANEAKASYRRAVELDPAYAKAHYNLGSLLLAEKDFAAAESAFRTALAIDPNYARAFNNLGNLLTQQHRDDEAEVAYRAAITLDGRIAETHSNLGNLLLERGRYSAAADAFHQALEIDPNNGMPAILLAFANRHLCAWRDLATNDARVLDLIERRSPTVRAPFPAITLPNLSADHLRHIAENKASHDLAGILRQAPLVDPGSYRHRERLRIGYLSADFHEHATMFLLIDVLENFDRERFDIRLYSLGPDRQDAWRQRAIAACGGFTDLAAVNDRTAAEQIAADGIDILVDLKGYTQDSRPGICAWRPAPVVVNWLGFPGTMGHPRLADYLIGDAIVTPPESAANYSETLAFMPHCYQPNDRGRALGPTPTRAAAGLPENAFVFASFNQAYKLLPETFDAWSRILRTCPGSVLWLLDTHEEARANLRREIARRGTAPERLVFAAKLPESEHLGRLRLADLALDTYPCGSHTTASDALWAGIPLIARRGDTFASRVSSSLLHAVGLDDLVADNWDRYTELAIGIATHPNRHAEIRHRLAEGIACGPLFDTERFCRDLEQLYEEIWRQQAQGYRRAITLTRI